MREDLTARKTKAFYELLELTYKQNKHKGPTYIIGDFDARIKMQRRGGEDRIGKYTFDPTTIAE